MNAFSLRSFQQIQTEATTDPFFFFFCVKCKDQMYLTVQSNHFLMCGCSMELGLCGQQGARH